MSYMSWMCSWKLAGMPAGVSTPGFGTSLNCSARSMRRFDFADAGQVFIELLLVATAELLFQGAGVVEDEIQDRPLLLAAELEVLASLAGRAGAEEPLEDEARIGLGGHGQGGGAPGQVVLVGAGIAGVAVAGLPHAVAGQLQRRETG